MMSSIERRRPYDCRKENGRGDDEAKDNDVQFFRALEAEVRMINQCAPAFSCSFLSFSSVNITVMLSLRAKSLPVACAGNCAGQTTTRGRVREGSCDPVQRQESAVVITRCHRFA